MDRADDTQAALRALHDEDAIFAREVAGLQAEGVDTNRGDIDWTGFVVAFKGVFLEGLEVVFIVLTFSANHDDAFGPSVAGAVVAFLVVTLVGAAVHRPLARVPGTHDEHPNWQRKTTATIEEVFEDEATAELLEDVQFARSS